MSERKLAHVDPDLAILEKALATISDEDRWKCGPRTNGVSGCLLWHLVWAADIPLRADYGLPYESSSTLVRLVQKLGFRAHEPALQAAHWNDCASVVAEGESGAHGYVVAGLRKRIDAYKATLQVHA